MKQCHGCGGKGWIDSKYLGPTICPLCKGSGELSDGSPMVAAARPAFSCASYKTRILSTLGVLRSCRSRRCEPSLLS